jgi:hypothetical protein
MPPAFAVEVTGSVSRASDACRLGLNARCLEGASS